MLTTSDKGSFILSVLCCTLFWSKGHSMICLSCNNTQDPGLCEYTVDCPAGKGCFIQEIAGNGSNVLYNTGCAFNNECGHTGGSSGSLVGKRDAAVLRFVCCHSAGCNEDKSIINAQITSGCFDQTPFICSNFDNVCSDPNVAQDCQATCKLCSPGGTGKQFFVEFSRMDGNPGGHIELLIVATTTGNATISVPYLNLQQIIAIRPGLQKYNISNAIIPSSMKIERKGVEILSTVPVNIYAINYEGFNEDGFAIIPADHLSTHYFVPGTVGQHEMTVLSPFDNNTVTIHLRLDRNGVYYNGQYYRDGEVINLQMDRMETFEILTGNDISGTSIVSSLPVSVVSGDRCSHLDGVGCDHLIDMIPPVETYTTAVIVPSLAGRRNSTVQIIAAHPDTVVDVESKFGSLHYRLDSSEHKDLIIDGAAVITSSKGILVTQFVHACCPPVYHEPFMMVLPGVDRYLSEYNFAVFDDGDNFQNHITIVIPQDQFNGLRLNGKPLPAQQATAPLFVNGVKYGVYDILMTQGAHHLYNIDGRKFGLFIHGNRYSNGYGYSAGMDYRIV